MEQHDALNYSTQASVGRCKGLGPLVTGIARTRRGIGMSLERTAHCVRPRWSSPGARIATIWMWSSRFTGHCRSEVKTGIGRAAARNDQSYGGINGRLMRVPILFVIGQIFRASCAMADQDVQGYRAEVANLTGLNGPKSSDRILQAVSLLATSQHICEQK